MLALQGEAGKAAAVPFCQNTPVGGGAPERAEAGDREKREKSSFVGSGRREEQKLGEGGS